MEIAFFHVDRDAGSRELAEIMVESARAVMPDSRIVQMTDMTTPPIEGVDDVLRKTPDGGITYFRMLHMSKYPPGDVLFVDTDVVFNRDVSCVFESEFDVALAPRTQELNITDSDVFDKDEDASERMPYNIGVMFSRSSDLWKRVEKENRKYKDEWFGDQLSFAEVVGEFAVKEIDPAVYNYTPEYVLEDTTFKAIVHYKGPHRKKWMMQKHRICKKSMAALI